MPEHSSKTFLHASVSYGAHHSHQDREACRLAGSAWPLLSTWEVLMLFFLEEFQNFSKLVEWQLISYNPQEKE